jgi:hypothetical protein
MKDIPATVFSTCASFILRISKCEYCGLLVEKLKSSFIDKVSFTVTMCGMIDQVKLSD